MASAKLEGLLDSDLWRRALAVGEPEILAARLTVAIHDFLGWYERHEAHVRAEGLMRKRAEEQAKLAAAAEADYGRKPPAGTMAQHEVLLPALMADQLAEAFEELGRAQRFKVRRHQLEPRLILFFPDSRTQQEGWELLTLMSDARNRVRSRLSEAEKQRLFDAQRRRADNDETALIRQVWGSDAEDTEDEDEREH